MPRGAPTAGTQGRRIGGDPKNAQRFVERDRVDRERMKNIVIEPVLVMSRPSPSASRARDEAEAAGQEAVGDIAARGEDRAAGAVLIVL